MISQLRLASRNLPLRSLRAGRSLQTTLPFSSLCPQPTSDFNAYTGRGRTLSVQVRASTPSQARQLIEENVNQNKVMLFTKSQCPHSKKARAIVGSMLPPDKFKAMDIDMMPECNEIQDAMNEITGGRTVPRVFVGGKFIGGADDTARMAETGELRSLFEQAGVEAASS